MRKTKTGAQNSNSVRLSLSSQTFARLDYIRKNNSKIPPVALPCISLGFQRTYILRHGSTKAEHNQAPLKLETTNNPLRGLLAVDTERRNVTHNLIKMPEGKNRIDCPANARITAFRRNDLERQPRKETKEEVTQEEVTQQMPMR